MILAAVYIFSLFISPVLGSYAFKLAPQGKYSLMWQP